MDSVSHSEKVKLIAGLFSNDIEIIGRVADKLQKLFGPIDYESRISDFLHTDYYRKEMGPNLKRKFLSFKKPVDLKNICAVKLKTNALEKRFEKNGLRTVNIDPGYLNLAKLVLFSTKDYTHRIYLGSGIYAEVTLYYKDGSFQSWPWTYPDYKTAEYVGIFNEIRALYKENE